MTTSARLLPVLLTILLIAPTIANGQVLPRDEIVAGKSQAEWSVLAGKWALEAPLGLNPIEDTTGEFSQTGDQGPIFFVDGTFGGPTVTRTATIRADQFIRIGLLNTTYWIPDAPTESELRALAATDTDLVDELFLEIDGMAVTGVNLFDYRIPSPAGLYDLAFPENNIVGLTAGTYPAVHDGYSVVLSPLNEGSHTLAFGGRVADAAGNELFRTSVIYDVTVVPEPTGLASLWLCCLLVRITGRRARKN